MNGMDEKKVQGHQRVSHIDGHGVNESYKIPSPTGKSNKSYMHPQVQPLSLTSPWQAVDKTLAEAARPTEQLGRSKTVFPVHTEKVRGAPNPIVAKKGRMLQAAGSPARGPKPPTIP
ncbi:MAG: hypothetical protein J2P13_12905 [Acidobacteria bacterium]|nr:hypothetical protein [Acidobacteriota bacterium]